LETPIYDTQGRYRGVLADGRMYGRDGAYLGVVDGTGVWSRTGRYVGELDEQMVLDKGLNREAKSTSSADRIVPAAHGDRAGQITRWSDVFGRLQQG
jgi:hypothetical protein